MIARPLAAAALLALAIPAGAQTDPLSDDLIAIKAKRIETVSKGAITNGVILVRNGRITAVGADVKVPLGAKVIVTDVVMPGIVGAQSTIGLTAAADDGPVIPAGPRGGGRFGGFAGGGGGRAGSNAHYRVIDELYPWDEAYESLLRAGVTTLGLVPGGRGIAGQGAVIKPAADKPDRVALVANAPLSIHFASDTATQQLIRTTLEGGRQNQDDGFGGFGGPDGFGGFAPADGQPGDDPEPLQRGQRRGPVRGGGGAGGPVPGTISMQARLVPIQRAVAGQIPTFVACTDAASTLYALKLFDSFEQMKTIWVLPLDSYRIADELAKRKATVVLDADLPFFPNTRDRVNTAAILAKAGLKLACTPPNDTVAGYEGLRFKMAELIRAGLDREAALKAITLHPAELLGVADRVGSIDTGRAANLVCFDGDPFDPITKITRVLLEGKTVYDGR